MSLLAVPWNPSNFICPSSLSRQRFTSPTRRSLLQRERHFFLTLNNFWWLLMSEWYSECTKEGTNKKHFHLTHIMDRCYYILKHLEDMGHTGQSDDGWWTEFCLQPHLVEWHLSFEKMAYQHQDWHHCTWPEIHSQGRLIFPGYNPPPI